MLLLLILLVYTIVNFANTITGYFKETGQRLSLAKTGAFVMAQDLLGVQAHLRQVLAVCDINDGKNKLNS